MSYENFTTNSDTIQSVNMFCSSLTNNCGMRCIRILLTLVNIIFFILGVVLVSLGTTVHAVYNEVQLLLGAEWFSPALFLTIVGVLVLLITAFGCLGTFKNSTCMINTFGALLLGLFVLEVIAAVSSFAMSGTVNAVITRSLKHAFYEYPNGNEEQRERVDFLQQEMSCCGIYNYADWRKILKNNTLPGSCCWGYSSDSYNSYTTESSEPKCDHFNIGCARAMHYLVDFCTIVLAVGTVFICIIQILGVTFAFQLAKSIRQAKTRQDMERWTIIQQEQEPLPQTPTEQEHIESRDDEKYIP